MDVTIVDERKMRAAAEPDYVRVRIARAPADAALKITTIERVVRKSAVKPSSPAKRVKTLIDGRPMTLEDALGFAKLYAARKRIKLVLTAREG